MASFIHNNFRTHLFSGNINLASDPIYISLVSGGHTPSASSNPTYSDISSYVVTGTNYVNTQLSNVTISLSSATGTFDADSVTWNSSTITASGAYLWMSGAAGAVTNPVIAYFDFGSSKSSSNGDFIVDFSSDGIIKIENG